MARDPRWWACAWSILIALSALRGLRFAHDYARVHWLLHYDFGFVKRALPGALVRPLLRGKTPGEINDVIDWCTAGIAIATAIATIRLAERALENERPTTWRWGVVVVATTTLMLSPFVASTANLSGYFDQLLVLGVFASTGLVRANRPWAAGAVASACVLTQEMFALFGLPVVALACILSGGWRRSAVALAPPLLGLLAVAASEQLGGAAVAPLEREVLRSRVVPENWVATGFHALHHDVSANLREQSHLFFGWLRDPASLWFIHPTTAALLALALLATRAVPPELRFRIRLAVVTVTMAPVFIAVLAWDWPRFFAMAQFHAYMATLLVLSAHRGDVVAPAATSERSIRSDMQEHGPLVAATVLAVVATATSWSTTLPRVASADEGDEPFRARSQDALLCRATLFDNSDFLWRRLHPWQATGRAFAGQPLDPAGGDPGRRASVRPLFHWVGTSEYRGDGATGTLTSPRFVIAGDRIGFRVSGTRSEDTHVRLLVAERERLRVTGDGQERLRVHAWDVAAFRGQAARLEVVDASPQGHINLEGFCYVR